MERLPGSRTTSSQSTPAAVPRHGAVDEGNLTIRGAVKAALEETSGVLGDGAFSNRQFARARHDAAATVLGMIP